MPNDDAILKAIASLRKDMATKSDLQDVKQGQARLEHGQQEQGKKLDEQGKQLDEQGKQLNEQGKQLDEQGKDIKSLRQEHGEKLDILLREAEHARTVMEALENKVDETKTQVDEIKQRQRPRHAD